MASIENVSKEALTLKPSEKAQLIDKLLSSLDKSDKEIDELWAKEVEERIEAYDQGKIKAISLEMEGKIMICDNCGKKGSKIRKLTRSYGKVIRIP